MNINSIIVWKVPNWLHLHRLQQLCDKHLKEPLTSSKYHTWDSAQWVYVISLLTLLYFHFGNVLNVELLLVTALLKRDGVWVAGEVSGLSTRLRKTPARRLLSYVNSGTGDANRAPTCPQEERPQQALGSRPEEAPLRRDGAVKLTRPDTRNETVKLWPCKKGLEVIRTRHLF